MLIKLKKAGIFFLLVLSFVGGGCRYDNDVTIAGELENVLIIGSAEHPDPILEMVRDLEKNGILRDVMVMESFPVQIRVTGSKSVIERLKKAPRIISPAFK